MNWKWKSTRSTCNLLSLLAFVLLLRFGLCCSLEDEGLDSVKCKETVGKYLWFDGDAANLKAIGLHRKILSGIHNPFTYKDLPSRKNRPATTTVSPAPTPSPRPPKPKPASTKSATVLVPPKKSSLRGASAPSPTVPLTNSLRPRRSSNSSSVVPIVLGCTGGVGFLLLLVTGVFFIRRKEGKSVNPWRTGLSGQLQKVFVTGIPSLKRSELEAACEDFSNVIGSCPIGKLFKGTLSSGIEIAVASIATTSAKYWKDDTELQFRKKIEMLSKINHKNFVNLLGFCEENEPFTRILIFEYAPNGSLFEHLHYKESEHLDWEMRLRIVMGVAYCLDHMHQLSPPIVHSNLVSSSLQLTEDYAVKVSDFSFSNQADPLNTDPKAHKPVITPEDNVYSFGVLLFETMTGKLPESDNTNDALDGGLAEFLRGESLTNMVDPTLESFDEKIEKIGEVIKSCVQTDPKERPTMSEVMGRLRQITGVSPNNATPKLSPLWWAELEVLSSHEISSPT